MNPHPDSPDRARPEQASGVRPSESATSRAEMAVVEALLEHSENPLVYLDRDFNFVRVNRAYAETCRRAPEDFIGHGHFEFYPHAENQRIFERVRDTGEPATWREKPFVFPDMPERGVTYWDWTLSAVKDTTGFVTGLVFSLVDVTSKVEARTAVQESEERFRTVLENSPDAIYRRSLELGRYVYLSPAIERITGYSVEEFSSWTLEQVLSRIHPDDLPAIQRYLAESGGRRRLLLEYRLQCRDGSYRWLADYSAITAGEDGKPLFIDGAVRDITEQKRAEEARRESEERFRVMVDGAPIIIWVTDAEGGVVFTNRHYREFFGVTYEQVEGGKWQPLVHPDDAPTYVESFRRAVSERAPFVGEARLRRADGAWRWAISSGAVRRSASGEFMGHVGMTVDFTERKLAEEALRESEARFRALADNSPDVIIRYDRELRCAFANTAAARRFGRSAEDIVGQRLAELGRPPPAVEAIEPLLREVLASGEARAVELDLGERSSEVKLVPERDASGQVVSVLNVARDVTERARLLAEAERASRAKDVFLATLSHELRTPMTAILLRAELLLKSNLEASLVERSTRAILRSARTQAQLIDDLLDLSRIGSGKLELRADEVALAPALEAALDNVREVAEAKGVILRFEVALHGASDLVLGDQRRLQQVVWNLLTNAVKFTPAGGEVTLRLARFGEQLVVEVRDTGSGIHPEFLPHIFQLFSQADRTITRDKGGLGLGLALVHHLVEAQRGTVRAESPGAGQGAVFTVTFPAVQRAGAQPVPPIVPSAEREYAGRLDGVGVLVVDEDEATRGALTDLLASAGAGVSAVRTVDEAVKMLPDAKPDLLICELAIPDEDGYQLMRRIRALPPQRGGETAALALTAYASSADREKALSSGFQAHLAKPTQAELLISTILRLVRERPVAPHPH